MRGRSLVIFTILLFTLGAAWWANRALYRVIRPKESPQRFFLFLFANFFLIVVGLISAFAVIVRLFPLVAR